MKTYAIILIAIAFAAGTAVGQTRTTEAPRVRWIVFDKDTTRLAIPDSVFRGWPCGVLFRDTLKGVNWVKPCGGDTGLAIAFPDSIILALKHGLYRTQAQWVFTDSGCIRIEFRPRSKRYTGAWFERNDTLIFKDTCGSGGGGGAIVIRDTTGAFAIDSSFLFRGMAGLDITVKSTTRNLGAAGPDTVIFDHHLWDRWDQQFMFYIEDCSVPSNQYAYMLGPTSDCTDMKGSAIYLFPAVDTLYLERVAIKNVIFKYTASEGWSGHTIYVADTTYWVNSAMAPVPGGAYSGASKTPYNYCVYIMPIRGGAVNSWVWLTGSIEIHTLPGQLLSAMNGPKNGNEMFLLTTILSDGGSGASYQLPTKYAPLYGTGGTGSFVYVTLRWRHKVKLGNTP